MTRALSISMIAAVALLGACDDDDNDLIIGGEGDVVEWTADVFGIGDFSTIGGSADVTYEIGTFEFGATANIFGDVPGAVRPWHVHFGSCADTGDIVGIDSDYLPFVTDSSGADQVSVIVPEALDPNGVYSVNFHLGTTGTDFDTIIACGDLVPLF